MERALFILDSSSARERNLLLLDYVCPSKISQKKNICPSREKLKKIIKQISSKEEEPQHSQQREERESLPKGISFR